MGTNFMGRTILTERGRGGGVEIDRERGRGGIKREGSEREIDREIQFYNYRERASMKKAGI